MKTDFKNIQLKAMDKVAYIYLSRPTALNALNSETLCELNDALDEVQKNIGSFHALVITGEGKAFAAGADIAEMQHFSSEDAVHFSEKGASLYRRIEHFPLPVIAAVNGFCLGGGCELALACDIRYASEKAKFGQPEVGLGLIPGFSGTQRLPRLVGAAMAKELIFSARIIGAEEAFRIGLVNRVVAPEELLPAVDGLVQEIAQQSPNAVTLSKEAINRGLASSLDSGIAIESDLFGRSFASPERDEGIRAFLAKEKPHF